MRQRRAKQTKKEPAVTGIASVDALARIERPSLEDYIRAVSEYVRLSPTLERGVPKKAQIALSGGLGKCIKAELEARSSARVHAGELQVAGALRTARADVSEAHPLDGLRLAIEIKPVNLAVGRAIWNRFGDIRVFAVNIHLKFPFAVVGGVLAVPTWEWRKATKAAADELADEEEDQEEIAEYDDPGEPAEPLGLLSGSATQTSGVGDTGPGDDGKKSTLHLIERLVRRLQRTPLRQSEADAAHLLEAVTVIVYDPDTATLHEELPSPGHGLRWDEFINTIVEIYDVRFE